MNRFAPGPPLLASDLSHGLAAARCGVFWRSVPLAWARELVAEGEPEHLFVAMGPSLYFARGGPWVAWDWTIVDQNDRVPVRERAWPTNLGDAVWAIVLWRDCRALLTADYTTRVLDLRLYLETPTASARDREGDRFRIDVMELARSVAGARVRFLAPGNIRPPITPRRL